MLVHLLYIKAFESFLEGFFYFKMSSCLKDILKYSKKVI